VVATSAAGDYKVRVSDPSGVFTPVYLWDRSSFDDAWVFGYT
jgi:hypothetical protein